MIGDKLIIKPEHAKAAGMIGDLLIPLIKRSQGKFVISVAGESGAGKSEIAYSLAQVLEKSVAELWKDLFLIPGLEISGNLRIKSRI